MTDRPERDTQTSRDRVMALAFPEPGRRVEHAYKELDTAMNGKAEAIKALGDVHRLPRPWDPPTCTTPELRAEVWTWLDQVVIWLNTEYVWEAETMIPTCWPRHPHLVHEVAVLADLRRRAGRALTGDALEEWHRYALPAFTDRMRQRIKTHCESRHSDWPALGRHTRALSPDATAQRGETFELDVASLAGANRPDVRPPLGPSPTRRPAPEAPGPGASGRPHLTIIDGMKVDPTTGEVFD
jgi:hypothetical protein